MMDSDNQQDREEHKPYIIAGIVIILVIAVTVGEAFAAQPDTTAPASDHLYFIAHLIVVIVAFLVCLLGAVHGYHVGAKNDGQG